MLKGDFHNFITYYRHKKEVISQKIKSFFTKYHYSTGEQLHYILHNASKEHSRQLSEFVCASEIINSLDSHSFINNDIDSSSEVSSSEIETIFHEELYLQYYCYVIMKFICMTDP